MRALVGLLGVAVVLAGVAPAAAQPEELTDLLAGNAVEGSRLFVSRGCVRCHAVRGDGGTAGPDLGRVRTRRPLLEVAGIMWNHTPQVAPVLRAPGTPRPKLELEETAHLLAFVYSLGHVEGLGDPAAGARAFRDKGCQTCHAVGGAGAKVGPALDKYGRFASPLFLSAALWEHGRAMAQTMREREIRRPRFSGQDIANLLAFLRASSGTTERIYARPGDPGRGKALFDDKSCAECHTIRGQARKTGPPDLGEPGRLEGSLVQITGALWNHAPSMWARMADRGIEAPSLSVEEMADLVSYLYLFQLMDPPGDPRRGLAVLRGTGCTTCHGLRAGEAGAAMPLADSAALGNPVALVTHMWNHAGLGDAPGSPPRLMLTGTDMADLVAYLKSIRDGRDGKAARGRPR